MFIFVVVGKAGQEMGDKYMAFNIVWLYTVSNQMCVCLGESGSYRDIVCLQGRLQYVIYTGSA